MTAELSELKQEVAELWARYRKEEPKQVGDESHKALAELNRALEKKRRALSDRSAALRHELDVHRRKASRLSPVVRVLGGIIGSGLTAAIIGSVLPELSEHSIDLGVGQGAVMLSVSLLIAALSVSRAER